MAELRIAGRRRVPAERARAALRRLELAHERGLGRDPRLVELVRRELVGERARLARQRLDRSERPALHAGAPARLPAAGARRGRRQDEQAGSRSACTLAYAEVTSRSRSRRRRGSRADSLWPSRIAATSSAATSGWRAAGTWKPSVRYASPSSRSAQLARGPVWAGSGVAQRGPARGHPAEPALDAAPHALGLDVAGHGSVRLSAT